MSLFREEKIFVITPKIVLTYVHTTSSKGILRQREDHDKLFVQHLSGRWVRFPALQKQGPLLSAFSFSTESKQSGVVSEATFFKSILLHISNRQCGSSHPREGFQGTTMGLALPFYLHSGQQPKSLLPLFDLMPETGIQHPPRRNSHRSSTTKEELGRSWKIFSKPSLRPITPQCTNLCRLPNLCEPPRRGIAGCSYSEIPCSTSHLQTRSQNTPT